MESRRSPYIKQLYVCVNQRDPGATCCAASDSDRIREKLSAYVKANGLKGRVRVSRSGCMDLCAKGPNVMVEPDHRWYHGVTLADADQIIAKELAPLVVRANGETGSMGQPVSAFLFDLGNVLVRFNHQVAAEQIAQATHTSAEELYRLFFDSPLVAEHDQGKISTPFFYEELRKQIGLSVSYEKFLAAWNSIFTEDAGTVDLARELLSDYPCCVISNTNRPHFEHCREKFPILNQFTGWILSYEVGVLKPDRVIYERALSMLRLPPSRVFYIDDRQDLIEAGEMIGFQTHRFTGVDLLRKELREKGLLRGS